MLMYRSSIWETKIKEVEGVIGTRDIIYFKNFLNFLPRMLNSSIIVALAGNVLWLCVCYFGLQTLAFKDKLYSQNNSTKPLLVAGAVN